MEKIKALVQILCQIVETLNNKQRKASIRAFILIFLASILELLGVAIVVPFISAVMNTSMLSEKWYIKMIANFFNVPNVNYLLLILGFSIIGIYFLKNTLLIYSRYEQNKYAYNLQKELSVSMLSSYMSKEYEFFVNSNSAEIIRGAENDVFCFCNAIKCYFTLFSESITMILIFIFIFVTDWKTALAVSVFSSICILGIILCCKNSMKKTGVLMRKAIEDRNKTILQAIGGVKDIYVMQRKKHFVAEYEKASEEYKESAVKYEFVNQLPERIIETVLITGIIGIVCIRLIFGVDSTSFLADLAALAMACFRLLPSLNKVTTTITQIIFYRPGLEHVHNNVTEICEHAKEEKECEICRKEFSSLRIENLYWKYQNATDYTLKGINLLIRRGTAIAFIGKSGAGKTTLADIILGLLHPQSGKVEINGNVSIFDEPKLWAAIVGYVPQMVFLLDDTIRENVAFGIEEKDDNLIWEALRKAQIEEFVRGLPNGLDTIVGERGVRFSGGQRQRIAIARALYYDPQILVLDEATSALDDDTEKAVMDAIDSLKGQKTLIIIAHRLSTIKNCDYVYEIEDGSIKLVDNMNLK